MWPVFTIDQLVADCIDARGETEPRTAVRDVLQRTVSDAEEVADAFAPTEAGLAVLHHAEDLTVLHVVWAPGMSIYPHNHRMWAAIAIYAGQEDNTFYRRAGADGRSLIESGGKQLTTGDVALLGDDTIHAVTNPRNRLTGAIHVYGGDFINAPRSQWGPGPLEERPFDLDEARRVFDEANAAWHRSVVVDQSSGC